LALRNRPLLAIVDAQWVLNIPLDSEVAQNLAFESTARLIVTSSSWGEIMTAHELLSVVVRRWYLTLLGAGLSVAALYLTTHQAGVYYTQFKVIVLAPTEDYYLNKIEDPHYALAPMAGVVVKDWNGTNSPLFTASGDTTLFGEGQRQGVQVRMPNQGSQWQPIYSSPNISVQVVDKDPQTVEQKARQVRSELDSLLRERQDEMGIHPTMRMTTLASPAVPTVEYISGSRVRTAAATGLAGAALTTIAVFWIDRCLTGRRSRRATELLAKG